MGREELCMLKIKTALMKTGVYCSKLNDFSCSKLNPSSSAWNLCYCMKDRSFFPLYCLSHQQTCFFPHFKTPLHLTFPSTIFLTVLLQQKSSKFLSTSVDVSFPLLLVSLESSSSNSWCSRLHPNLPCCQAHQWPIAKSLGQHLTLILLHLLAASDSSSLKQFLHSTPKPPLSWFSSSLISCFFSSSFTSSISSPHQW